VKNTVRHKSSGSESLTAVNMRSHALLDSSMVQFDESTPVFQSNIPLPSSGLQSKQETSCLLFLHTGFFLGLIPGPEDGSNILVRNIRGLLPNCVMLQHRRSCFSYADLHANWKIVILAFTVVHR
jgi:hypothetical protein